MTIRIATPIQSHKFAVVPNYPQPEMAEIFTNSVREARIDLINKTLTVSIIFSGDDGHLEAINSVINSGWIPEIHFDNGDMVFQFMSQKPPIKPAHSLTLDYSTTDVAKHIVVWSFGDFKLASFRGVQDRPLEPADDCITIGDWFKDTSETQAP